MYRNFITHRNRYRSSQLELRKLFPFFDKYQHRWLINSDLSLFADEYARPPIFHPCNRLIDWDDLVPPAWLSSLLDDDDDVGNDDVGNSDVGNSDVGNSDVGNEDVCIDDVGDDDDEYEQECFASYIMKGGTTPRNTPSSSPTQNDSESKHYCYQCKTSFSTQQGYDLHERISHNRCLQSKCPACGDIFPAEHSLDAHWEEYHEHDPLRYMGNGSHRNYQDYERCLKYIFVRGL